MNAKDLIDKGPYGSRFRSLHRRSLWRTDFLPAETRRTWPVVLPVAALGAAATTAAVMALASDWPKGSTLAGVAGLLVASVLAEAFPLPIEGVTVSTLAVGTVLGAYNWPLKTERYNRIARFVDAFFSKFEEFQKAPVEVHTREWRERA